MGKESIEKLVERLERSHQEQLDSLSNAFQTDLEYLRGTMQNEIDSLSILASKPTGIDVLNQVNEFYSTAWSDLLWVVGSAGAFVGFILPALWYWMQRKNLNERLEIAEGRFQQSLDAARADLELWTTEHVSTIFNDESKRIQKNLDKVSNDANAAAFHIQARMAKEQNDHKTTLESSLLAAKKYSLSNNLTNCRQALNIVTPALKSITADELLDLETEMDESIDSLLVTVDNGIGTNVLGLEIGEARKALKVLRKKATETKKDK